MDFINDSRIYVSRFKPNPDNTSIIVEEDVIIPENKKNVYWKIFGNNPAYGLELKTVPNILKEMT